MEEIKSTTNRTQSTPIAINQSLMQVLNEIAKLTMDYLDFDESDVRYYYNVGAAFFDIGKEDFVIKDLLALILGYVQAMNVKRTNN